MPVAPMVPAAPSAGDLERRALAGRAGVVAAGTLLSRLLGLGRDITLAAQFTRAETDAFSVAFVLPNALRALLGEGAATSAVVPVLAEVRATEGDEGARHYFRGIRGVSVLALSVVTVLGIVGAPVLIELFASGFHAWPGKFERTVVLARWFFPYIFFMGTAALGMAALNTYGRFVAAAFAPALLNVALIAAMFLLPSFLQRHGQDRILALAVGVLLGGLLQVVAQWPSLRRIGFGSSPRLDLRDPNVRKTVARLLPLLAGIGIYEIDLIFSRRLLSALPEGAQSYFFWAQRLCDFPQGVFVLALQSATLPSLAKLVAVRNFDEVSRTYAYGMRLCLFVALPATALFAALALPLVITIFQRGAFDPTSSAQTAHALLAQGLGIWTVAAVRQLLAVFYALGDTRTPVIVSAIDLLAFIVAALFLRGPLGHVGVSFAVSISSGVQMLLLWIWLGRRLPSLRLGEIGMSAARTSAGALVAAALGFLAAKAVESFGHASPVVRLLSGAIGAIVFVAIFVAAARLLKSPELDALVAPIRDRMRRRRR